MSVSIPIFRLFSNLMDLHFWVLKMPVIHYWLNDQTMVLRFDWAIEIFPDIICLRSKFGSISKRGNTEEMRIIHVESTTATSPITINRNVSFQLILTIVALYNSVPHVSSQQDWIHKLIRDSRERAIFFSTWEIYHFHFSVDLILAICHGARTVPYMCKKSSFCLPLLNSRHSFDYDQIKTVGTVQSTTRHDFLYYVTSNWAMEHFLLLETDLWPKKNILELL